MRIVQMQKFDLFIWLDEAEIVIHTCTVVDEDTTFHFNKITIHLHGGDNQCVWLRFSMAVDHC